MVDRRDTRVTAGVGVVLHVGDKKLPCMSRNLSRGGMFAVTKAVVAEGESVIVEVVHKGSRLKARARVAQRTEEGLGLSFVDVNDQFRQAMRALMDDLVAGRATPSLEDYDDIDDDTGDLKLAWAYPGEGSWWKFWQKRRYIVDVMNLTLDGVGFRTDARPEVEDSIIIYLEGKKDALGQPLACQAEVVRHTDEGFAVKFFSPSVEFRRAISEARKAKFGG
jgi:hypothetical protein